MLLVRFGKATFGGPERDVVGAAEQFVEHRADLGAGQHRAQAVVRSAAAERDVRVLGAADVECERIVEDLFVAVGRAQHRHHPITLRDGDTVDLDVDLGGAGPERDRRRPAQHLFDRARAGSTRRLDTARSARDWRRTPAARRPARSWWCRCRRTRSRRRRSRARWPGWTAVSPFSSVTTAEVSVLQMSSTGLRRFSAVSSSA